MVLAQVAWSTESAPDLRTELERLKELLQFIPPAAPGLEKTVGIPIAPLPKDNRMAILVVDFSEDESVAWTLVLTQAPKAGLKNVEKASVKAGGRDAVTRLAQHWWGKTAPTVDHRIHFHAKAKSWKCRSIPTDIVAGSEDESALSISDDAVVESVGYRFQNGAHGIMNVSIDHEETTDEFSVTARAKGILKFGTETWLPFATEVRDVLLETLFEEVTGG